MPKGRDVNGRGTKFITVLAVITGLFWANVVSALTLQLQSGLDLITVTDNGPGDSDPTVGVVWYIGPVGTFTLDVISGFSKPYIGGPLHAQTDLSVSSTEGIGQGNLIIRLTDTGFSGPLLGTATVTSAVGGVVDPGGSATVQAYVDPNNAAFGTGPSTCTTGPQGPFGGGAFDDTDTVSCVLHGPFSISLVDQVHLRARDHVGFDHFVEVESPACGAIGDFVWHDMSHDGIQDAGEPGLNGVTLELRDGATLLATTNSVTTR